MSRCLANCLLLLLVAWSLIAYFFIFSSNYIQSVPLAESEDWKGPEAIHSKDDVAPALVHHESVVTSAHNAAIEGQTAPITSAPPPAHQRQVHAFFYLWYKSVEIDGRWEHWNHRILPHWDANIRDRWPHDHKFEPPGDFGAAFAPRDGLYSSADPIALARQFGQMRDAGITAAALSWWGRPNLKSAHDGEGVSTDELIPIVMKAAEQQHMKVVFHLEPYEGRTPATVREDIEYLVAKYGDSPAFYRHPVTNRAFYYAYDSYHNPPEQWAELLKPEGKITIRGDKKLDADVIGLVLESKDIEALARGGFDGAYTYFASEGFTFASSSSNWQSLAAACASHKLQFVPSVGPGYDDSRIRPWNAQTRRARDHGAIYNRMWAAAVALQPSAVSITSWNEWGEGTQIEPVRPYLTPGGTKLDDYEPEGGDLYLTLTKQWASKLNQ